jgi:hypothetical protein
MMLQVAIGQRSAARLLPLSTCDNEDVCRHAGPLGGPVLLQAIEDKPDKD